MKSNKNLTKILKKDIINTAISIKDKYGQNYEDFSNQTNEFEKAQIPLYGILFEEYSNLSSEEIEEIKTAFQFARSYMETRRNIAYYLGD